MALTDTLRFLNQQSHQTSSSQVDLSKQETWHASVKYIFNKIDDYLNDYVEKGLLRISHLDHHGRCLYYGLYPSRKLKISVGFSDVFVVPYIGYNPFGPIPNISVINILNGKTANIISRRLFPYDPTQMIVKFPQESFSQDFSKSSFEAALHYCLS